MDPIKNLSANDFYISESTTPENLLKIVNSCLQLASNPFSEIELSYSDYIGRVKLFFDKSTSYPDEIVKKIYHKCLSLLAFAEIKFNTPQNPLTIKFKNSTQPATYNRQLLSSTILLSDLINRSIFSDFSETANCQLNLDITKNDFETIIKMAIDQQLAGEIDLLELYSQASYLQIKSLEPLIAKEIKDFISINTDISAVEIIHDYFSQILTQDSEEICNQCIAKAVILHCKNKNYTAAIQYCTKTLELIPNNTHLLSTRARIYLLQNNLPASLTDINATLLLEPNNVFTLATRARIHLLQNNLPAALTDANNALLQEPTNVFTRATRASIYFRQNNLPAALTDANNALQLAPNDAEIQKLRNEIELQMRRPLPDAELTNPHKKARHT